MLLCGVWGIFCSKPHKVWLLINIGLKMESEIALFCCTIVSWGNLILRIVISAWGELSLPEENCFSVHLLSALLVIVFWRLVCILVWIVWEMATKCLSIWDRRWTSIQYFSQIPFVLCYFHSPSLLKPSLYFSCASTRGSCVNRSFSGANVWQMMPSVVL